MNKPIRQHDVPPVTKRAEAAIKYFEDRGRSVVGVTIKGTEFSLEFAQVSQDPHSDADLVGMGK